MAILRKARMANFDKMAIMATMAINMANLGVYPKNRRNEDTVMCNRNWKKCIGSIVMAKTKYIKKKKLDCLISFVFWSKFCSDLPQFFCGSFLCISTCNPNLGIKSYFSKFGHTLLYTHSWLSKFLTRLESKVFSLEKLCHLYI